MKKVFLLYHGHAIQEEEVTETRILGIYSTETKAQEAIARYMQIEGFRDHPEGFEIEEYYLDRTLWEGGFFTIDLEE